MSAAAVTSLRRASAEQEADQPIERPRPIVGRYGAGARGVKVDGRQLSKAGSRASAVDYAFAGQVDYAMLQKIDGEAPHPPGRYFPAVSIGAKREAISGHPDPDHVAASYIEHTT